MIGYLDVNAFAHPSKELQEYSFGLGCVTVVHSKAKPPLTDFQPYIVYEVTPLLSSDERWMRIEENSFHSQWYSLAYNIRFHPTTSKDCYLPNLGIYDENIHQPTLLAHLSIKTSVVPWASILALMA